MKNVHYLISYNESNFLMMHLLLIPRQSDLQDRELPSHTKSAVDVFFDLPELAGYRRPDEYVLVTFNSLKGSLPHAFYTCVYREVHCGFESIMLD